MGNSSSSTKQTQLANERAHIRFLGERFPLGDGELRKWVWCHGKLSSPSPLPSQSPATSGGRPSLAALAAWSAIYGDYNPFLPRSQSQYQVGPSQNSDTNSIQRRFHAAKRVEEAVSIIEQHIFPEGLSSRIIHEALGVPDLSSKANSMPSLNPTPPKSPSAPMDEIMAWEESFYSLPKAGNVTSNIDTESSQTLDNFLEGISIACGRRGSRSSLKKLFSIVSKKSSSDAYQQPWGRQQSVAEASELVFTAYTLALAASYLKCVALNTTTSIHGANSDAINWKCFEPTKEQHDMQSMVGSLLKSAETKRQGGGGISSNNYFDYSYPAAGSAANSNSQSSGGSNTTVSLEEFLEWAETTTPMIASALPTFLHVLFSFFSPKNTQENQSNNDGDVGKEPQFPPGVTPLWIPNLTTDKPIPKSKNQNSSAEEDAPTSQTQHPSSGLTSLTSPSSFFDAPPSSSFYLFALSCTSIHLAAGRWHRLFSSEANGLSCNRLMHSILGYGGPTLILIRTKDSSSSTNKTGSCGVGILGAYTFTPWSQESGGYYGNSDCFLFRLGPDPMAVYHPKGGGGDSSAFGGGVDGFGSNNPSKHDSSENRNFMYFNPEARSKGYDGLAHGIGFGGNAETPRLFIDEVLDGCRASSDDLTFDNGPLLSGLKSASTTTSPSQFEVEAIEAWGVGGTTIIEEALFARDGQRRDAEKRIRQAMKGAKGQFLEDFQSGLAGSKMFQHREQMRGRDNLICDLENEEKNDGKDM